MNKVFLLFLFSVLFLSCSTAEKKRFTTLSVSRDVSLDDVKQPDKKLQVPLWASNTKAYQKELLKQKASDADAYKYFSAQSSVATIGSIETCYKMAAMNIKSNISSTINEAFMAEFGMTREGDSEQVMAGYVQDTMANVTQNVFRGLEREDVFYKEILDNTTDSVSYQCFVLYSIKKSIIEQFKLGNAQQNKIPKEAKETITKAIESTKSLLITN